jgi:PAS domain S-box-containing protein
MPADPPPNSSSRRGSARGHPIAGTPNGAEQYLQLLIESVTDYAIFSTDLQRHVNTWNIGAERIFGFSASEIIGQPGDVIFTPEDRAAGAPLQEAATALRHGRAADERWHLKKNGERFWASGMMMPLTAKNGNSVGFVKITRDLTARKLGEERERQLQQQLETRVQERTAELHATNEALRREIRQRQEAESARQELARRINTAQEEERLRTARELHDEIGQHLAGLMLGLNSLEPHLAATPGASLLPKLQELTEQIGREVHTIAVQLRPAALDDLGLVRAIASYVDVWSSRTGIPVELRATNLEERRLPRELELALYRIVQEALTNIMKHAAASHVSLILNRLDGEVVAVVEDNGDGFDADAGATESSRGLGLLGMRERAALLRGRVTIESERGRGTTVFARFPVA